MIRHPLLYDVCANTEERRLRKSERFKNRCVTFILADMKRTIRTNTKEARRSTQILEATLCLRSNRANIQRGEITKRSSKLHRNMCNFITETFQYQLGYATSALLLVHGLTIVLAPHRGRELYMKPGQKPDFKDPDLSWRVIDNVNQLANMCMISCALVWWLIVQEEFPVDKAMGVMCLIWVVFNLYVLLNDIPQKVNASPRSNYINVVTLSLVAYATLGNTEYARLANKIESCFVLANGVIFFVNPSSVGTLYAIPDREDCVMVARRNFGNNLTAMGVVLCALAWDVPTMQANGLAWASVGLGLLWLAPVFKKHNHNMTMIYGWLIIMFFCAAVFLATPRQDIETEGPLDELKTASAE